MKPDQMIKGGHYNWKNQKERLIYLGENWSGNGYWHQFALVEEPTKVWCEVKDYQLEDFEKTDIGPISWEISPASGDMKEALNGHTSDGTTHVAFAVHYLNGWTIISPRISHDRSHNVEDIKKIVEQFFAV